MFDGMPARELNLPFRLDGDLPWWDSPLVAPWWDGREAMRVLPLRWQKVASSIELLKVRVSSCGRNQGICSRLGGSR